MKLFRDLQEPTWIDWVVATIVLIILMWVR